MVVWSDRYPLRRSDRFVSRIHQFRGPGSRLTPA